MQSVRIRETTISKSNIDAQVAAFLYSIGFVNDDEDVIGLEYGLPNTDGTIPLKIKTQKDREVRVIKFDD